MVQLRLLWLVSAALFLSASSQSQTASPQPQTAPASTQSHSKQLNEPVTALKVTTRLVVLDVVATDGKGRSVTDLKPQDFTVLEDGKRQEVRVFNFRQPLLANAPPASTKAVKLPANVFTNTPAYKPGTSLNVILLDLLNTDFNDQAYGRQQVLKYLAAIPDGEPIAVAVYTLGRKLRLVQDFTSDFAALRNVVNSVKDKHSLAQENSAAGDSIDSPLHSAVKELAKVYQGTEQLDRRVQYTLEGLSALAKILSGFPGRKNLIWISTTFPVGVANDDPAWNTFGELRDYEKAIVSVSQALVDAQVAVYPVDPRGPLSLPQYSGQESDDAASSDPGSGIPEYTTMKRVAQFTGGKAYYNQNDIDDVIRNSIADGSTYYTLAYYPDNKDWNGNFRKIEVKVNRRGLKLRHRPGYYALNIKAIKDTNQPFAAFGRALNLDSPVSTALRFEAGLVQPSEKTQNKVLLNFALDPRAVTFEHREDGLQHATVDCAVQAYSEKGELIKTDANTLSVALDSQAFSQVMQNYLLTHVTIDLPPGLYLLRLGAMDEHTGLIGTTNARVTINPSASGESKPAEKKASSSN